jgi:hypothetical protein
LLNRNNFWHSDKKPGYALDAQPGYLPHSTDRVDATKVLLPLEVPLERALHSAHACFNILDTRRGKR